MRLSQKRLIQTALSLLLVGGAISYLLASGISGGEYYKHVSEIMGTPDAWRGKRLQVHGHVKKGTILRRMQGNLPEYRFDIEEGGKVVSAHYVGLVPDTFKDDAEVVCKGRLTADNTLEVVPDGVLAKCPSKYDAKKEVVKKTGTAPSGAPR